MSTFSTGHILDNRFRLVRPLGKGGMAEVWLVRDEVLDEQVVAKILPHDASADLVTLLRRECRNARRLIHPNIVRIHDFHRDPNHAFLTMEHVEGTDLGRYRGQAPEEILRIVLPVADAMAYAHDQGIVHRDLKPSNVLCDAAGRPRVLDLGIAAALREEELTLSGGGSRYYVSPQQLQGEPARPADDLYALGALIYELISEHPPFWPDLDDARILHETPAPLESEHAVPRRLQSLVESLLAKAPGDRPPDMASVVGELRGILDLSGAQPRPAAPAGNSAVRLTPPPRAGAVSPVTHPTTPAPVTTRGDRPVARPRRWTTLAAIGIPGLAAIAILAFLPRWSEMLRERGSGGTSPPGAVTAAPTNETAIADPVEVSAAHSAEAVRRETADRLRAERGLERVLVLREILEAQDVEAWADDEYYTALAHAEAGDAALGGAEYAVAAEQYGRAASQLEALESGAIEVLRAALEQGRRALSEGDSHAATAAFELAAKIAPANQAAAMGLRRAAVLDDHLALLDAGLERERAADRREAERLFRQAVQLDPLSQAAQEALARVQAQISDDEFSAFMSRGLAALNEGRYGQAREFFARAAQLRPDARQVADGLAQVDSAEKLDAIAGHRDAALAHESVEEWKAATERYDAVLGLDPTIVFAQEGKTRCLERASVAERIEFHLAHPDRLSADEVLEQASQLHEEASRLRPAGPRHLEQLRRLAALLGTAGSAVRVRLQSDEETSVTVYHVGRLGTFLYYELELRPGIYTVIGSRDGFRDVRLQLTVVAGEEPEPLIVRCEEEI